MIRLIDTVGGGLWVGSWESTKLDEFDVVVLMAPEVLAPLFDDRIVRFPASDQPPYGELFRVAHLAAAFAESAVNLGKRVAVCCREGFNRSVLACALVLHWRQELGRGSLSDGEQVLAYLRERVGPRALYNDVLADYVCALKTPRPR